MSSQAAAYQSDPLSAEQLNLLRAADTPTVCNVIELFGIQSAVSGYMDERIRACFEKMPPMVGYAITLTCRSAAPSSTGASNYATLGELVRRFADVPNSPIVVMQNLDDPPAAADFGEVMCAIFKAFGAAGVITSGSGRDLDQIEAIGFPAFVSGVNCSHGYPQLLDVNVPVHVGGMTIQPGDLLHGDRNGVTTIPHQIAGEVADNCQAFMDCEKAVLDIVAPGEKPTADHVDSALQLMGQRISELKSRLSGGTM